MNKPQIWAEFEFVGGQVRCSFDNAFLDELEIAYAVPHRAWRGDEWEDPETKLDVPPPRHEDVWWCHYTVKVDAQGNRFAVLMPVELVEHGPPHYVSAGRRVLIEQAYRRDRA
jgi:hypothetical protein